MHSVVGEIAPLAVAIAATPFPLIPAIMLLFTARPRATAAAFLAGWSLTLVVLMLVFSAVAGLLEGGETPLWASWVRLVLGVALVVFGIAKLLRRPREPQLPGWMAALDTASPARALRFGMTLAAANPKNLALLATAGLAVGAYPLAAGEVVLTALLFAVIASVLVAAPLIALLIGGVRAERPLRAVRDWLVRYNAVLMAVVVIVIGVLVVVTAVSEVMLATSL